MWGNDDFFGGMFDLNGDGHTDEIETAVGFQILDDWRREDSEKNDDQSGK